VRLNAALASGGNVTAHASSPDGQWVVYMADQETAGVVELWSVRAAGGVVTRLTGPLAEGGDVLDFRVGGDNATVVYLVDGESDGLTDLYCVPIGGGVATLLTGTNAADIEEFDLVPDGNRVVYRIGHDIFSALTTGGTPLQLTVPGFDWPEPGFKISPDSRWVVYVDDVVGQQGLAGLAVDGSNRTGYTCCIVRVTDFRISADSSRVAWQFETNMEFYTRSMPIDGGTQTDLDDSGIVEAITPDGSRAIYRWITPSAKSPSEGDLRSVPVTGGAATTLNPALVSGGEVLGVRVTADSQLVV
jgi:Tol biopolymer transport system component